MNLSEVFEALPGVLFVLFVFGGWVITSMTQTIAKNWRDVRRSEHLAAIKELMIEKGMSVDEIERVVNAGMDSRAARNPVEPKS